MRAAGYVVEKERLVGCGGVQVPHVLYGVVREVSGEVIAGMPNPRIDLRVILEQIRSPLVGLAAQEAVEVLKAHTRGPLLEGSGCAAVLETRSVMVFAKP